MSSEISIPPLPFSSDELLTAALDDSTEARHYLGRAEAGYQATMRDLVRGWNEHEYRGLPDSVHLAGTLACLPSLVMVATLRPHSIPVAEQVTDNFQRLGRVLANAPFLGHATMHKRLGRRAGNLYGHIEGTLSEIGILGTIWWGIANGLRAEQTYALPATYAQDRSSYFLGFKTGVDIIISDSESYDTHEIQVKATQKNEAYKVYRGNEDYYPDIAKVVLRELRCASGKKLKSPAHLLKLLSDNRATDLRAVHQDIEDCITQAQADLAAQQADLDKRKQPWQRQIDDIRAQLFG